MGMPPDCIKSAINKMHLECSTMAVSNSNATVKCLFVNKMNRLRKLLLWKQMPSVKGKFDTFNETCLMFIFNETIYSSG